MNRKQYFLARDIQYQNGMVPMMMNGMNGMYGLPLFKPSLYPNISSYQLKITPPNMPPFVITLTPDLVQRLMVKFFENQKFEKVLGNNVRIEFITPTVSNVFSVPYGPY